MASSKQTSSQHNWLKDAGHRSLRPSACSRLWLVLGFVTFGLLLLWPRRLQFLQDYRVSNLEDLTPGTVRWWPCWGKGYASGAECGEIIVPLDYLNPSAGIARVALGRYKATGRSRKGMVLFNPGGPGGTGKLMATKLGPYLQTIVTTEDYDIVGFDPRGIGESKPQVRCFQPPNSYQSFKAHTVLDRGFNVAPNLTDPRTRDLLIVQQQEAETLYQTQFQVCNQTMGELLRYMGTTTVSRDIDLITTVLEGKDALINFYGLSYGTILGATVVNMFPNRIGRVVIDGVADPLRWFTKPPYTWYRSWLENSEDAYQMFLSGCSEAGPKVCPLAASKAEDPSHIEHRIEKFLEDLYTNPLAVPYADNPGILTSGAARAALFTSLAVPQMWPMTAVALSEAIHGNGTDLLNMAQATATVDLERSAVSCNDNHPLTGPTPEQVVDETLYVLKTVTRFGASVITTEPDSGCQFWPVNPPERFQGPWNHTLNNPILIHSNLADPVTPAASGRLVNQLLGSSSILALRTGPGHGSFSLPSLCTVHITRNYFDDGSLPLNEHICPTDASPFPDPHTEQSFSGEDATVLEHLRIVAQELYHIAPGGAI